MNNNSSIENNNNNRPKVYTRNLNGFTNPFYNTAVQNNRFNNNRPNRNNYESRNYNNNNNYANNDNNFSNSYAPINPSIKRNNEDNMNNNYKTTDMSDNSKINNNPYRSNRNMNNNFNYNAAPRQNNIIRVYMQKHSNCIKPLRASNGASGYDIFAAENVVIPAKGSGEVATNLKIAIPKGYEMQIRSRSGLYRKNKVIAFSGTIDSDYRGEIKICLDNFSDTDYNVTAGDRIAQGVFAPVYRVNWIECDQLHETNRGEGGFGASGLNGDTQYSKEIRSNNNFNNEFDQNGEENFNNPNMENNMYNQNNYNSDNNMYKNPSF